MKIDKNFVGGNIEVLDVQGDTVTLANELRDTRLDRDWFYWAFRVRGAQGKTVTFQIYRQVVYRAQCKPVCEFNHGQS